MSVQVPGLETKSSGLTIFLSFFGPGLGHLYLGKVGKGVTMLVGTIILYSLTWFMWSEYEKGQELDQLFFNSAIREADETGRSHDEVWKELEPIRREHAWFGSAGLGLSVASFAWWVWAMVSARKLCERLNRETFDRAKGAGSGA